MVSQRVFTASEAVCATGWLNAPIAQKPQRRRCCLTSQAARLPQNRRLGEAQGLHAALGRFRHRNISTSHKSANARHKNSVLTQLNPLFIWQMLIACFAGPYEQVTVAHTKAIRSTVSHTDTSTPKNLMRSTIPFQSVQLKIHP